MSQAACRERYRGVHGWSSGLAFELLDDRGEELDDAVLLTAREL